MKRIFLLLIVLSAACNSPQPAGVESEPTEDLSSERMRILLDTDANNELDDQHAIAYLLFNPDVFEAVGITVNATFSGGGIENHVAEAERVVGLCGFEGKVSVLPGASDDYADIVNKLDQPDHDGHEAVDFIIEQARKEDTRPLILVPIGTLTNVALALAKAPDIADKVRVMWLGSNWPGPGEYNLDNDTTSVNPLLEHPTLELDICTVRYGQPSGTAAVLASVGEIRQKMAGLGPQVDSVAGRHGGVFTCFGDYSVELFNKIGDQERSLFDVCALSILKNPTWARASKVPAPRLVGNSWVAQPGNARTVVFWENFKREKILADFYESMDR